MSPLATYGGYDPFGREGNTTLANGVATEKLYDPRSGRITSIRSFNASKDLQNKAFAYYTSGDVKSITNTVAGLRYDYNYDALHRLTREMQTSLANPLDAKETTYAYEYNGNILTKSEDNGAVSLAYQYNDSAHAHAVTGVVSGGQTFAYVYDANGNLTSGRDFPDAVAVASRAITYNPDGLPSRIVHDTGSSPLTTDFAYDGDGYRVKKTAGNRFTLYVGDYFEKSENGASKFLFANGSRIAKIDNSGTYYFHQDHLGSNTVVSSATGNAVAGESAEYKPFGGFRVALDSTVTNYRFTDQEFDPESNLYYYDARYYDPIIGRFVSADTVIPDYTDPQSLNRYSYVKNNPLMYVDPTGHLEFSVELGGYELKFGSDAGEKYGDYAAQYWATKSIDSRNGFGQNIFYGLMGGLASLWTPGASEETFLTLFPGEALGKWAGRPFYRYFTEGVEYTGSWSTRGWGWNPPHELGYEARRALNLPPYNEATAIQKYMPKWYKPVTGPRTPASKPEWGWNNKGVGKEYFDGWRFPPNE